MSFLTPFMLVGALAAGIPVAIHLFFRSRYRTVPWAAMKFLLTSVEQTSRQLKFQELLLLLLRMLVLAMLAFAFARPISSAVRGGGRGDAVDAVLLFDVSFSMGAQDGGKTRMKRAQEEALKIIDELPPHSTVQILTCAGKSVSKPEPRSPANFDLARKVVEELQLTHLATDLADGIVEAQSVLARGQTSNKELYVFSDMQKQGFEQQTDKLKSALNEIKDKTLVHMVRCGTRPIKNAAIVAIAPQSGMPQPGERISFSVMVKNTGEAALENLTVSLVVDGDEKNVEKAVIAQIPRGETRAATLTGKMEKAGLRVLTARVGPDELDGDNRFDQVLLVREQVNILVVDGNYKERELDKSSSYYLMYALLPQVKDLDRATFYLQPRVIEAWRASPALLTKQDICVLVNCSLQAKAGLRADTLPGDFTEALEGFVKQGRALLIFGGDNVQAEPYNKVLGQKLGLLPLPLKGPVRASKEEEPFQVNRNSFDLPAYVRFKEEDLYKDFANVSVWQALGLDESAPKVNPAAEQKKPEADFENPEKSGQEEPKEAGPVSVLLRLNNNAPLVASKRVGEGEVIFIATAADCDLIYEKSLRRTWTDWPLHLPVYVPFIHGTVNHLIHGQTQTQNRRAGEVHSWQPHEKIESVYDLVHPDGETRDRLLRERKNKRVTVTASDLPRAGVYHIVSSIKAAEGLDTFDLREAIKTAVPLAVTADLKESEDLSTYSAKELTERLGFEPIHIVAGEEAASTGSERMNREWTVWALLAVLLLVMCEVVLAWWCGRAW